MVGKAFLLAVSMQLVSWSVAQTYHFEDPKSLRLWLTISARKRFLEVSWRNAPARKGDRVLITTQEAHVFQKRLRPVGTPLAAFPREEGSGSEEGSGNYVPINGYTDPNQSANQEFWVANGGELAVLAGLQPSVGLSTQWFTTGVPFDYELSKNVTAQTHCYGFWASYINEEGDILARTCLKAFPRWMNDLKSKIGELRLRDLFIPGTHDSGSYRPNFDPLLRESLVTKYALTQDDDIRGQLMHGVRYLDIRVGYYRNSPEQFFIYHGITKQRPLQEVINQVRDFVHETNEIIIFGLKEFPIGFGKGLGVHRLLVTYLRDQFQDLIAHPSLNWSASLRDIWARKQNVFLAYEKQAMLDEFPETLFGPVDQRWGNVQTWPRLETYLRNINEFDVARFYSRPIADMAELTPETWDVILDKHGGLRKMSDNVNWRISLLYRDELGTHANIVAADFIRGTTLVETAMDFNLRKIYEDSST
ncbi:PI-PLC X domain-containing protein 1 [Drosophila kikkawai]|uniref:PI-PLC X domain-containing protein 1 n=1 Tax=Drosophila kikkawai TaxID=30033 RepID=A0A6P4IWP1_DROKI|nr:PI-PLC X domain-containing protein 1 [Drosophila kikkawai]